MPSTLTTWTPHFFTVDRRQLRAHSSDRKCPIHYFPVHVVVSEWLRCGLSGENQKARCFQSHLRTLYHVSPHTDRANKTICCAIQLWNLRHRVHRANQTT